MKGSASLLSIFFGDVFVAFGGVGCGPTPSNVGGGSHVVEAANASLANWAGSLSFAVRKTTAMCRGKMKFQNISVVFEFFRILKSEIDFIPSNERASGMNCSEMKSASIKDLNLNRDAFVPTPLMTTVIFSLELIEPPICVRWCSNKHWFVIGSMVRATRFGLSLRVLRHSSGVSLFIRLMTSRLSRSSSSQASREV